MRLALEPYNAVWSFFAGHSWRMEPLPAGDGHPVLVYPGLGASGVATTELRMRLLQIGYQVYDWELGVVVWPCTSFDTWLELLAQQLQKIRRAHNRRVSLVGWSLGGLLARELAILHPTEVRQVITLGTPVGLGLQALEPARLMGLNDVPASASAEMHAAPREMPPVPCASIYSRSDGVVAWENCVDPQLPDARNIEINGASHFGLVHHPDVLRAVAQLLAEPLETQSEAR